MELSNLKLNQLIFKNTETYKQRDSDTEIEFGFNSWKQAEKKLHFSQLASRLLKPNSLSIYVSVFVCIGVFKDRLVQLKIPNYHFEKAHIAS